ncbi:MAG TPA: hypothetical protein VHW72_06230 [Candidatus Angelobacter sp.]|nr:hypothetical protein [Candidatus Angelobacter sp.]
MENGNPEDLMLVMLAVLILLVIILLIVLLRRQGAMPEPAPPTPPSPSPALPIPDHFDEPALANTLALRLVGTPADGSRAVSTAAAPKAAPMIWVDHGDEVLVHFEAMQVRMLDGVVLVSIDLETDQTGRTPLVVSIALGKSSQGAGLLAVTDEYPRGNGILASRWGAILQDAVWASLLGLAKDHALQTGQAPRAIGITAGKLTLQAGIPLQVGNPS